MAPHVLGPLGPLLRAQLSFALQDSPHMFTHQSARVGIRAEQKTLGLGHGASNVWQVKYAHGGAQSNSVPMGESASKNGDVIRKRPRDGHAHAR